MGKRRRRFRPGPIRIAFMATVGLALCAGVWTACARRASPPGARPPATAPSAAGHTPTSSSSSPAVRPVTSVRVRSLGALLPTPLMGLAAATVGRHIYLVGGAGPQGYSAAIYAFTPPSASAKARITKVASLPAGRHDGAAVSSGGALLFCGGGRNRGHRAVYRYRPGGTVHLLGRMSQPLSDLAGVTAGGTAYCLGGYNGTSQYSAAVYAVGGATAARQVATLPRPVRYAAAAAAGHGILVVGGRTNGWRAVADIQWVPLRGGGKPVVVGSLPRPLYKAMGATLPGAALVIGGCGPHSHVHRHVYALSASGAETGVGRLPTGWCYGAAAVLGGRVYVFGGHGPSGRPSDRVWELIPGQGAGG